MLDHNLGKQTYVDVVRTKHKSSSMDGIGVPLDDVHRTRRGRGGENKAAAKAAAAVSAIAIAPKAVGEDGHGKRGAALKAHTRWDGLKPKPRQAKGDARSSNVASQVLQNTTMSVAAVSSDDSGRRSPQLVGMQPVKVSLPHVKKNGVRQPVKIDRAAHKFRTVIEMYSDEEMRSNSSEAAFSDSVHSSVEFDPFINRRAQRQKEKKALQNTMKASTEQPDLEKTRTLAAIATPTNKASKLPDTTVNPPVAHKAVSKKRKRASKPIAPANFATPIKARTALRTADPPSSDDNVPKKRKQGSNQSPSAHAILRTRALTSRAGNAIQEGTADARKANLASGKENIAQPALSKKASKGKMPTVALPVKEENEDDESEGFDNDHQYEGEDDDESQDEDDGDLRDAASRGIAELRSCFSNEAACIRDDESETDEGSDYMHSDPASDASSDVKPTPKPRAVRKLHEESVSVMELESDDSDCQSEDHHMSVATSELDATPPSLPQLLHPESIEIINPHNPKLKPQSARMRRYLGAVFDELPTGILQRGILADGDDCDFICMKVGVEVAQKLGEREIKRRMLDGGEYYSGIRRLISARCSPVRSNMKGIGNNAINMYELPPKESAGAVVAAIAALKSQQGYIFTDPSLHSHSTAFRHDAIIYTLHHLVMRPLRGAKHSIYSLHPQLFMSTSPDCPDEEEIPPTILASAALLVFYALDVYPLAATTHLPDMNLPQFKVEYFTHFQSLTNLAMRSRRKYHKLLHEVFLLVTALDNGAHVTIAGIDHVDALDWADLSD